ncbi:MAG: hypothetical protein KGI33_03600 [Thaumarchaeota archaeon]|nr:hypothetical protein [Nitrososphaerota archaeon]
MTNSNDKIKKTKATTTVIGGLIIGLIMLSPMTLLPIGAQATSQPFSHVPEGLSSATAASLSTASQQIDTQLQNHPGWIGIVKYNGDKVDILYVGDPTKSPYYNPRMAGITAPTRTNMGPLQVSCNAILQQQGEPTSFTDSGTTYTTAYHLQQKFTSIQATPSNLDLLQTLNGLNAGKSRWMQISDLYDNSGTCTGTGAAWYYNIDQLDTSNGSHITGYPQSTSFTSAAGDVIYEDGYANGSGNYQLCVTDVSQTPSTGGCYTVSNSGNNFALGTTGLSAAYDTGTMMEETSTGTTKWQWGTTSTYTMKFQATSNSNLITTCNGWVFDPDQAHSVVTLSSSTNPCQDGMKY